MKLLLAIIVTMLLWPSYLLQAQGKFGFVNLQAVYQALPDYQVAEAKLKALKENRPQLAILEQQYRFLFGTYQRDSMQMPPSVRVIKKQAIANVLMRMKTANENYDKQMATKRTALLGPIEHRVKDEVRTIAQARHYKCVFNLGNKSVAVYFPEGDDVTELIKKRLTENSGAIQKPVSSPSSKQ